MKTKTKAGSAASAAKPRHLCEGWLDEGREGDPVFYPDRGYCLQGGKAWVAFGDTKLDESMGDVELVENFGDLELEEKDIGGRTVKLPKDGVWIVEGPAQRSDVKNANQRTYSRKIWETLIEDGDSYVQTAIKERRMLGHLEHPKDGRTELGEATILTTGAKLLEDGTVWGRFEILETPKGLILQELIRKGVKWGVSSRGTGSVGDDGAVSEEDYKLKTWDAVASPSTPGAHPNLVTGHGKTESLDDLGEARKYRNRAEQEQGERHRARFGPSAHEQAEKANAKKMKAKGYRFIIVFPGNKPEPLYAKTLSMATELIKDHGAPKGVKGQPIDSFIGESNEDTNTEEAEQGALSAELQETVDQFVELSEADTDSLSGRVKLRRQLLDTLASLDENALQRILQQDQGWSKIAAAVAKARESEDAGASIDAAIDEALASGNDNGDTSAFEEIIESLQEEVSLSVTEIGSLNERLGAAGSERDAQAERLVEAEGELARLRVECDLANELLSETPGRNAGVVAAAADEAIDEVPTLEEHRTLLESVGTPEQVRTLAERLAPSEPVIETVEEEEPVRASRTALPVGLVLDSTDYVPSKPKTPISESSGARIVASMPGFKKNS